MNIMIIHVIIDVILLYLYKSTQSIIKKSSPLILYICIGELDQPWFR